MDHGSMTDVWSHLEAERLDLADFLDTLTPEEWNTPSLCGEWLVRDVAAHLAIGAWTPPVPTVLGIARNGFSLDRWIAADAKRLGADDPAVITARLRSVAGWRKHPPGIPKTAPLIDVLVHGLDIRRPLGKPRAIPAGPFGIAAHDFTRRGITASKFGSRARIAGLRLQADDLDWSTGDGPVVSGSSAAILLMFAQRPVEPDEFTGDGAPALYARLRT